MTQTFERGVVIVGGCGHVGLPHSVSFADRGLTVDLYDIDAKADRVRAAVPLRIRLTTTEIWNLCESD